MVRVSPDFSIRSPIAREGPMTVTNAPPAPTAPEEAAIPSSDVLVEPLLSAARIRLQVALPLRPAALRIALSRPLARKRWKFSDRALSEREGIVGAWP